MEDSLFGFLLDVACGLWPAFGVTRCLLPLRGNRRKVSGVGAPTGWAAPLLPTLCSSVDGAVRVVLVPAPAFALPHRWSTRWPFVPTEVRRSEIPVVPHVSWAGLLYVSFDPKLTPRSG